MAKRQVTLDVEERQPGSSNVARRLRNDGRVPAIVYGAGRDSAPISVDPQDVVKILRSDTGQNTILTLQLADGETEQTALIVDYQVDPFSHRLLHADFKRISMTDKLEVEVPIHVVGATPEGVKEGGVLDQILRTIGVRCLPGDIPEHVEIDASHLEINDTLHVDDLQVPEDVEILEEPHRTIVVISPPISEEELESELEAEGLLLDVEEPELIGAEEEELLEEGEVPEGEEEEEEERQGPPQAPGAAPASSD